MAFGRTRRVGGIGILGLARPWACLATLVLLFGALAAQAARAQSTNAPDDALHDLEQAFKRNEDKYDAFAKQLDKAVVDALETTAWLPAEGATAERKLGAHPYRALIGGLADPLRKEARKSTAPATQKLIARYPWSKELELLQGLQYGSDRAIPDHENGFIKLGAADPFPGFPDLPVNVYLFGLDEIVGWQFRVKSGTKVGYEGRAAKDGPVLATDLPGWHKARLYLQGVLPDVPLFAIPSLTQSIHCRLAERRKGADGKTAPMDEMLALMSSHWNGFTFEAPWSKNRVAVVQPLSTLYGDRKGFLFQFPPATKMESVGDMPFVSVTTLSRFAETILGQKVAPEDFIGPTDPARVATDQFVADSHYLARYIALIDELVRAVVAPGSPYPKYLEGFDFPAGKGPTAREVSGRFERPRKYAVLLWAGCGKDPRKVADFLHDNLLGSADAAFPQDVQLQSKLSEVVRGHEKELMQAVVDRIAADRAAGPTPGDFEREFSPYATYLTTDGATNADYLLCSFQSFHAAFSKVVQDTARAAITKAAP